MAEAPPLIATIDFRKGVKEIFSESAQVPLPPRIDQGGKKICQFLTDLAVYIAEETEHRINRINENDLSVIKPENMKEIMSKILPEALVDDAVKNGDEMVTKFDRGLLQYKRKSRFIDKVVEPARKSARKSSRTMKKK